MENTTTPPKFPNISVTWVLANLNTITKVKDLFLMIFLWCNGDFVWASFYLVFILISTSYDAIACYNLIEDRATTLLAILQIFPLIQTNHYFEQLQNFGANDEDDTEIISDYRFNKFVSIVLQIIPTCFLQTYVLFLKLHSSSVAHLVTVSIIISVLALVLGVTEFVASNENFLLILSTLIQIVSQFVVRTICIAAIFARFKAIGIAIILPFLVITFLFGPLGFYYFFKSSKFKSLSITAKVSRAIVTPLFLPLTFFLVLDPSPSNSFVRAHHYFSSTKFLHWRVWENLLLTILIAASATQSEENGYSEWLDSPLMLFGTYVSCTVLTLGSWGVVSFNEKGK